MHVLLSMTRQVAPPRQAEYSAAWRRVHAAALQAGVHAWRFRGADAPARWLEFLEWRAGAADPCAGTSLGEALARLDAAFPGERSTWNEDSSESSEEGKP